MLLIAMELVEMCSLLAEVSVTSLWFEHTLKLKEFIKLGSCVDIHELWKFMSFEEALVS